MDSFEKNIKERDNAQTRDTLPSPISIGSLSDDLELEGGLYDKLYVIPDGDSDEGSQRLVSLAARIIGCNEDVHVVYCSAYMSPSELLFRFVQAISDGRLQYVFIDKEGLVTLKDKTKTIKPGELIDLLTKFEEKYEPFIAFSNTCVEIDDWLDTYENYKVEHPKETIVLMIDAPHLFLANPSDDFLDEIALAHDVLAHFAAIYGIPIITSTNAEIEVNGSEILDLV